MDTVSGSGGTCTAVEWVTGAFLNPRSGEGGRVCVSGWSGRLLTVQVEIVSPLHVCSPNMLRGIMDHGGVEHFLIWFHREMVLTLCFSFPNRTNASLDAPKTRT